MLMSREKSQVGTTHKGESIAAYARNKGPRERVAPDFLIGAHATEQADALLTSDAGFFRNYFVSLNVVTPEAGEQKS